MKYTHLLLKTAKESPTDEDAKNAELLIRGGFVQKEMAGVYSYLPLGLKVLRKIEAIIREEMNAVGANELLMPALSAKENWEKTGRWEMMHDILYRMEMSGGRECALHPTHEETVTPLVQQFCASPKDFPKCVYQIQTKFRNEPRAKSGLLRGREFQMKDAYSFHTNQEDFEKYYGVMTEAYHRIYKRLGLGELTKFVAASGGEFSDFSHEFQTISPIGEDEIFWDEAGKQWLNKEITPALAPPVKYSDAEELPMEDVEGKGLIGVEPLAEFLKIPVAKTTKTILFETDTGDILAAALRGNYDVDERKLKKIVGAKSLKLASAEKIKELTGAELGYAGVLNLPESVRVIWDDSCQGRRNFEMGANKTDFHTININFGRDLSEPEEFYDIKVPQPGDINPKTKKAYPVEKAIEVANIFPLGEKYSRAFKFSQEGKPIIMGCYGIGISRLMGTLVEIFHDENGIIWPENVAPAQVYLAPIGRDPKVFSVADKLYDELQSAGIEVLYDDRQDKKTGPGQKFADHELLGLPFRVVLSEKLLAQKEVEVVDRKTGKTTIMPQKKLVSFLTQ